MPLRSKRGAFAAAEGGTPVGVGIVVNAAAHGQVNLGPRVDMAAPV